jgi:hypothetical protein
MVATKGDLKVVMLEDFSVESKVVLMAVSMVEQ